jgi:hypothetical protein
MQNVSPNAHWLLQIHLGVPSDFLVFIVCTHRRLDYLYLCPAFSLYAYGWVRGRGSWRGIVHRARIGNIDLEGPEKSPARNREGLVATYT